ncbi:MAG: hypothetical protein ACO1OC_02895 [Tuberibacillus sp.]
MNVRGQLLKIIKSAERRLMISLVLKLLFETCVAGLASGFFLFAAARWFIFPQVFLVWYAALGIIFVLQIIRFLIQRPNPHAAAKLIDRQGGWDEAVTALQFLDDVCEIAEVQRARALPILKGNKVSLKVAWKSLMNPRRFKQLAAAAGILAMVLTVNFLIPSDAMKQAASIRSEQQWVDAEKKKIEKALNAHKKDADPTVKEELKKIAAKLEKAKNSEQLLNQLLEAEQKMEAMRRASSKVNQTALNTQLGNQLQQALQNGNQDEINKKINEIEKTLKNGKNKDLQEDLNKLAQALGVPQGQVGSMAALEGQIEQWLGRQNELASMQSAIQGLASNLNKQMAAQNFSGSRQLSFANQNMSGTANGGQNGTGKGQGFGKGKGSGNGSGSGSSSSGSGNGSGSNGGSGTGGGADGSGSGGGMTAGGKGGSGAGKGSSPLNYLTVPEKINSKGRAETDSGPLASGDGNPYGEGISPTLPGVASDYSQVIGYYESLYRNRYISEGVPSALQEMISDYYTEMKGGDDNK